LYGFDSLLKLGQKFAPSSNVQVQSHAFVRLTRLLYGTTSYSRLSTILQVDYVIVSRDPYWQMRHFWAIVSMDPYCRLCVHIPHYPHPSPEPL